jgi:hypothetical protein
VSLCVFRAPLHQLLGSSDGKKTIPAFFFFEAHLEEEVDYAKPVWKFKVYFDVVVFSYPLPLGF